MMFQDVSVLFETQKASGLWTGLTDHYVKVGVRSEEDLANTIRPVRISGLIDGLALGQLTDDPSNDSTAERISVSPLSLLPS